MKKLYVVVNKFTNHFIAVHQANSPGDILSNYPVDKVVVQLLRNCFYLSRSDRELLVEPFAKIKRREKRQQRAFETDNSAIPNTPFGTITVHRV